MFKNWWWPRLIHFSMACVLLFCRMDTSYICLKITYPSVAELCKHRMLPAQSFVQCRVIWTYLYGCCSTVKSDHKPSKVLWWHTDLTLAHIAASSALWLPAEILPSQGDDATRCTFKVCTRECKWDPPWYLYQPPELHPAAQSWHMARSL